MAKVLLTGPGAVDALPGASAAFARGAQAAGQCPRSGELAHRAVLEGWRPPGAKKKLAAPDLITKKNF